MGRFTLINKRELIKGSQLEQYDIDFLYSAATFVKPGFEEFKINVVAPDQDIRKNMTYTSAIAVKEWIKQSDLHITGFNPVTIGYHARRSKMLFDKEFDDESLLLLCPSRRKLLNC
jgi:hypothetical protein